MIYHMMSIHVSCTESCDSCAWLLVLRAVAAKMEAMPLENASENHGVNRQRMDDLKTYPLVNIQKTMENHHF